MVRGRRDGYLLAILILAGSCAGMRLEDNRVGPTEDAPTRLDEPSRHPNLRALATIRTSVIGVCPVSGRDGRRALDLQPGGSAPLAPYTWPRLPRDRDDGDWAASIWTAGESCRGRRAPGRRDRRGYLTHKMADRLRRPANRARINDLDGELCELRRPLLVWLSCGARRRLGCPRGVCSRLPRPEALIDGFMKLREKIAKGEGPASPVR